MEKSGYKKLAKLPVFRLMGQASLWIEKDHLLSVIHRMFAEEYKRFYFKDIQSIVFCRTVNGTVVTVIFGVLAAMTGGLMLYGWQMKHWPSMVLYFQMPTLAFFLLVFLIYLIKGPTCICYLRTAVQSERMYALRHIRRTMKVIRRIRAEAEAAQGTLVLEDLAAAEKGK